MTEKLAIEAVIGISGDVPGGLIVHPNGTQVVYSLGSTVIIREMGNSRAQGAFPPKQM